MADQARLAGQMKQNQNELEDYLRDLKHWQKEMEVKDEQLKKKSPNKPVPPEMEVKDEQLKKKSPNKPVPPPRSAPKSAPKSETPKASKDEKIGAYEYGKWDKLNVDKMMKELDDVSQPGRIMEIGDDDQIILQEAVVEKERGNDFFKRGKYSEAVACYTRGLKCDAKNAALAANRAMAYLKLNKIKEAEDDCTLAISLDPTYTKAYARRATARSSLKRYQEAINDYQQVLNLEPANKVAKLEIEKLKNEKKSPPSINPINPIKKTAEKKNDFSENLKKALSGVDEDDGNPIMKEVKTTKIVTKKIPGEISAIDKPQHLRSKKPMRRIPISEVGDVDMEAASKPIIEEIPMEKVSEISKITPKKDEEEISEKFKELRVKNIKLCKPKTFVEFLKTWKRLNLDKKAEYLRFLRSGDYPVLFKHSLEPDIFDGIIRVLSEKYLPDISLKSEIPSHLLGLTKVPRISAIVMFLDEKASGDIKQLLQVVKNDESLKSSQKISIEKCFK